MEVAVIVLAFENQRLKRDIMLYQELWPIDHVVEHEEVRERGQRR